MHEFKEVFDTLSLHDITIDTARNINYGVQLNITKGNESGVLRVYSSKKKGVTVDTSQIKLDGFKRDLDLLFGKEVSATKETQTRKTMLSDNVSIGVIGTDESGKGDFFGPLVTAGVYVSPDIRHILIDAGIKDCKVLKDADMPRLATIIKKYCPVSIISLNNAVYNETYASVGNLNTLLGICHMKAIDTLLHTGECDDVQVVLIDQFARGSTIDEIAVDMGISNRINIEYRPKAEDNIAVAAASIVARAEFIRRLGFMSSKYGVEFPKGCNRNVKKIKSKVSNMHGPEVLNDVAKTHFKV